MSRAINISKRESLVQALCNKLSIGISVIETLPAGGTRVVLNNAADAHILRQELKTSLIEGPIVRSPMHACRTMAPYR